MNHTVLLSRANSALGIATDWVLYAQRTAEQLAEYERSSGGCRVVVRNDEAPNYPALLRQYAGFVIAEHRRLITLEPSRKAAHLSAIAAWRFVSGRIFCDTPGTVALLVDNALKLSKASAQKRGH